ncbi:MAG TPA: 7-cyano-7-deazaguanine synthase QueC [Acidimicrobiales bacterium]|nr:7-cyano-7-deazaguanine synthase QueC [Acidimicrobiales bacterium]
MSGAGGHVVLLSGGLDSTVCLALAAAEGRPGDLLALTFAYGQRHRLEVERAAAVAAHYGAEQLVVELDASAWGGSALTDPGMAVPTEGPGPGIPVTYVPARNIIFLAVALGVAEARGADGVHIGVNAVDYSGYPDCRPEFLAAFRQVAAVGQKRGVEGCPVDIRAPLIAMPKAQIVRIGTELGAPLELTWSCYQPGPGPTPCGGCDSCRIRAAGFLAAGIPDPALSAAHPA